VRMEDVIGTGRNGKGELCLRVSVNTMEDRNGILRFCTHLCGMAKGDEETWKIDKEADFCHHRGFVLALVARVPEACPDNYLPR